MSTTVIINLHSTSTKYYYINILQPKIRILTYKIFFITIELTSH